MGLQAPFWKIYWQERAFRESFFNIFKCTFSWFTSKFSLFTGTFPLWLFDGHIIVCTGGMTYFFTTVGLFFTGVILPYFSRVEISFHGCDFAVFFTGRHYLSGVVSENFSRGGLSFHGCETENFHGRNFFFTGKKKHWYRETI